jgi:hypothetical protein
MNRIGYMAAGGLLAALAACADTSVPNNPTGVGFGNFDGFDADLQAADRVFAPLPEPDVAVRGDPLAAALNSGVAPVQASPANPAPQVVTNAVGISDENDFDAVSGQRDIAQDATLIAQNRAQYVLIQPTDVPVRPGTNDPNIVEYALRTTNPVGAPLYRRLNLLGVAHHLRACAAFPSPDLAQEAFLAQGGPERDRRNLDPDGDGFACTWDPRPFRMVRGG